MCALSALSPRAVLVGASLAALASACAPLEVGLRGPGASATVAPTPMAAEARDALAAPRAGTPAVAPPAGVDLELRAAEAAALSLHPSLEVARVEREVLEAEGRQAGRRPNPEVGLELENFGESGPHSGSRALESTLWVEQRLEAFGQRAARRGVAELTLAGADAARVALEYEVRARARAAFMRALAAQGVLELAREGQQLAERLRNTVAERVAAGSVSPIEATRADVAAGNARMEYERARQDLAAARAELARTWEGEPSFGTLVAPAQRPRELPRLESLRSRLDRSPLLERWDVERSLRATVVELERARARPQLTVRGGLRHFSDDDDVAAVVSVQVPLPLMDRRRDAIDAARARLRLSAPGRRAARLELEGRLANVWSRLSIAHTELDALENAVLPDAQRVLEAVEEAYALGRLELLELLDAQRTWTSARARHLAAQAAYDTAWAELEAFALPPPP